MDKEKLAKKLKDPNITRQEIERTHIEGQKQLYDLSREQEQKVDIRPDKSVSKGKFKPDPLLPGSYRAHPSTLRALKKNLFVTDEELLDHALEIDCPGCKQRLDLQFWRYCPYCESDLPKEFRS